MNVGLFTGAIDAKNIQPVDIVIYRRGALRMVRVLICTTKY